MKIPVRFRKNEFNKSDMSEYERLEANEERHLHRMCLQSIRGLVRTKR